MGRLLQRRAAVDQDDNDGRTPLYVASQEGYEECVGQLLEAGAAHVDVHFTRDGDKAHIDRVLTLDGKLDDAQRARLADIAERTPVTLTLKGGIEIRTRLA